MKPNTQDIQPDNVVADIRPAGAPHRPRLDPDAIRQEYDHAIQQAQREEAAGNRIEAETHYQKAEYYLHLRDLSVVEARKVPRRGRK